MVIIYYLHHYKSFMLHEQLTEQVIGSCFKVQTEIGSRLDPNIYYKAFEIEANNQNWSLEKEKKVAIKYQEQTVGERIVNFIIEGKLALNIKSIDTITPYELEEMRYCLKLLNLEVGLIINYGNKKVEIRRIEANKKNNKQNSTSPEENKTEEKIEKQADPVVVKKEDDVLSTIDFDSELL